MKFVPRLTKPEKGNKYYITRAKGGYSTAIVGKPTDPDCNVLHNCVGYAFGRFNEILGDTAMKHLQPVNAENFYSVAKSQGLQVGQTPKLGSVVVWQKGATLNSGDGAGHVAVVEQINADGSIVTSESGYNCAKAFWTQTRTKGNGNWGQSSAYKFLGFIYPPTDIDSVGQPTTSNGGGTVSQITRTLKKGLRGDDVKTLQSKLVEKGYLRANEVDGDFGKVTLGALLAFQLENGLSVDGLCGPATRAKLGI